MKIIKLYFFLTLFMFNLAKANDEKNYLSTLPHEMLSEILNNLDVESINNFQPAYTTQYLFFSN